MNIYILPNFKKDNSELYVRNAVSILRKNNAELSMPKKYQADFSDLDFIEFSNEDELVSKCDIILAVGGDGTILKASAAASKYDKPILGLNCGRLGFMCTLEHNELELLDNLCNGDYEFQRRIMLDGEIFKPNGENKTFNILPDKGYKIKSVIVNDMDKTDEIINNELTLLNIIEDTTINVEFEKLPDVSSKIYSIDSDIIGSDTIENPETHDNILLYVGLGLVSIIGLILVIIYFKKVFKQ